MGEENKIAGLIIGGRRLQGNEYIAAVEDTLTTNVRTLLDKLGVAYVEKIEQLVPVASGKLQSSFQVLGVKREGDIMRLEIGVGAEYNDYVDKGVRGIENKSKTFKNKLGKYYQFQNYYMPPEALKSLEGWAKRKNIEIEGQKAIDKNEGRPNKTKLITSPAKRLAYYIKKYGIDGSNFKERAFKEVLPKFEVEMKELTQNTMMLKMIK